MADLTSRWDRLSFRLPVLIAVFAALTGIVAGGISYIVAERGLVEIAKERMELVRNERARAVTTYIENTRISLASLVTRPGLADDIIDFSREFTRLTETQRTALIKAYTDDNPFPPGSRSAVESAGDVPSYNAKHKESHDRFLRLAQIKELDDLLLIDMNGNVVYSSAKESDFGANFLSGPLKDTNAAKTYRAALVAQPPWSQAFADMEHYPPSNAPMMFMAQAVPDRSGAIIGVLMFQLNNIQIRNTANYIQDLGNTGEVYLVGADATRRSQTRFSNEPLLTQELTTESAARSAAGFTASSETVDYKGDRVISAYGPLNLMGVRWGIVSKMNRDEALAPLTPMVVATGSGVLVSTAVIALFGFASARRISLPLERSLRVMEKLSQGDLRVEIADGNGIAETRQISGALRAFHANLLQTEQLITETRKNREQLSLLLDSSPTGIIVLSSDNIILFVNDPGASIIGRHKSALLGATFSFAEIACDEAEVSRMIVAARRDGVVRDAEFAIRDGSGADVVLKTSVRRTVYEDRDAYLIWFEDITRQKGMQREIERALEETKAQRARTDAILAGAPDPIIIVRSDSTIEYVNDQVRKVLGYEDDELIGQSIEKLLPARFRTGHRANVRGFFETNRVRMMGEGRELFALAKNGREVAVEIALSPIQAGGKPVVVALMRDITERKKAAAELGESQQLLSGVIQNSETVIFVKRQGRYIMVNKAWEKMSGISAEDARNKTDLEIFDEESARKIMINDAAVIASRAPAEYEEPVNVGGRHIHYLSVKFPYFNAAGEVDGLCGMSTDITQRIASEKVVHEARDAAEAATRAKSEFLASMSHEIRTPMNGITGMADLLAQTALNDEQKHMVRTIRESGNALITVINDILDFSKIEAGKMDLESVTMSVADAVEGVAATLTPNAVKKGVSIHVFVDPNLPPQVHGDPTRLRQILFNLGGNAVKFSNGRDVQIRAGFASRSDAERTWIRFNVIDQGIGISAENQAKLFQAFSQAESSTTRRFGGTGLGLAICRRLVDMMGGAIGVDSREGMGSTFWVELPFQPAEGAASNLKERDLNGLTVLLVGSDGPRRDAIETYVRHYGGDVRGVPDTEAAIVAARKTASKVDSVMLDFGLDIDRQEAAAATLRKALGKETPVIVLQDYQNRGARIIGKDVVTVDANPLIRYRIVSAVAVAAGRASPQIKADADATTITRAKAPTVDEALAQGQLILLAEDNLTNQDVIRRQLNLVGYTCELAGNGVEALKAYKTGRYALLLTDCHMPEMDGYELTGAIREAEQGTGRRLPIIAVTANALQGEAERCLASGMDDYITKPVAMPALIAALKKWMPAAKSEPAGAVIDERAIKDIFGDDPGTFKEILVSFVEPSQAIISEILVAHEKRAAGGIKDAAHKLKSSARSVGANVLADICVALEKAGKNGNWSEIDSLAPKARDEFGRVEVYIKRL